MGLSSGMWCFFCGKQTLSRLDLVVHVTLLHGDRLSASLKKPTSTAAAAAAGGAIHAATTPSTAQQSALVAAAVDDDLRFECDICGKRFSRKLTLQRHEQTHTGVKPFQCPVCGKGLSRRHVLVAHLKTHEGLSVASPASAVGPIYAPVAPHELHCTEEAPMSSDTLGASPSGSPSDLDDDQVEMPSLELPGQALAPREAPEKPFACPDCGRTFSRKPSMKRHQLVHSGEKPNECSVCLKRFARRDVLIAHVQRAHGPLGGGVLLGEQEYGAVGLGGVEGAVKSEDVQQQFDYREGVSVGEVMVGVV